MNSGTMSYAKMLFLIVISWQITLHPILSCTWVLMHSKIVKLFCYEFRSYCFGHISVPSGVGRVGLGRKRVQSVEDSCTDYNIIFRIFKEKLFEKILETLQ